MNKVLVYRQLPNEQLNTLKEQFEVAYYPDIKDPMLNDEFLHSLKTANALFGAGLKITESVLDKAPKLNVISNFSAGYDNLDLELLSKRNIIATNAPEALIDTVADLIFALLLSTARRIVELDTVIRNGSWKNKVGDDFFGTDVHHKKIGILGLGKIGKKVAQRAKGFDMDVFYHKRSRDKDAEAEFGAIYVNNLNDLLSDCDFICVTVPLTNETEHIINIENLKLMKSEAILINGSRGSIIKEDDLIEALKNKELAGAGLDVFEKEPLSADSELLLMDNVILTPHIGSATLMTRKAMIEQGIENLLNALEGKKPRNILNEETLN